MFQTTQYGTIKFMFQSPIRDFDEDFPNICSTSPGHQNIHRGALASGRLGFPDRDQPEVLSEAIVTAGDPELWG